MNIGRSALVVTALALGACTQQESAREIDWAKAALARNPNYEIVATDETAGVFTVRDTTTGDMSTLKLGDLIAAPRAPRAKAAPVVPEPGPEVPEDAGEPALAEHQTTAPIEMAAAADGASLAEGPGYRISRATGDKPETTAATLEGPGYKIEKPEGDSRTSPAEPESQATNIERRTDPIICQGDRLMRIDGQTIEFTGDAVIAERGCDLYISNARIRAGGIGIIARQARVHIVNSTIGGTRGSYEVSEGAEIYVAQSTFTGVGRRFEGGSMNDLGGNSYSTH